MSEDFKNNFSWSNSRLSTFKSCKRKYYFNYYGFWDGWDDDAPERVRTIYLLKKLNNRHTWKGTIIHEAIAFLLKSLLESKKIDKNEFKEAVVERMRNQYRTSDSGNYKEDPKNNFGLFEHYYEEEIDDKTWQLLKESVLRSIDNFRGSKFWKKAQTLSMEDCLALEGNLKGSDNIWNNLSTNLNTWKNLPSGKPDTFSVDGVKVWVKLDCAYPEEDGSIRVIDWKSGNYEDHHPDMTKKGNPRLKRAVFTSTMSAVTCNPVIKRHYEKQLAKSKDRMVALGSCMRKLVHIIYGILTSGEEFDPNYEQKRNETEIGRTRKPQSGSYPEDERSSEFSPENNNGKKIPNYQLAGGEA